MASKQRSKATYRLYLLEKLPAVSPEQEYFIHLLFRQRIYSRRSRAAWIPLSKVALRDQLGQKKADNLIRALIEAGIVESDNRPIPGKKCTGYRLTKRYRRAKHVCHELTDKFM